MFMFFWYWQLRLELKIGSYIFAFLGLVKPAYYIFKFVRVSFMSAHCILVDVSTVVCLTSPFVVLGQLGLVCCFYPTFDEKVC